MNLIRLSDKARRFVILWVAVLMPGCGDHGVLTTSTRQAEPAAMRSATEPAPELAVVRDIIGVGHLRTFGPYGPKEVLPRFYYMYVREHPEEALQLLIPAIASEDEIERCNAYDFIAELTSVPITRARAEAIMRGGLNDKGLYTATFVGERIGTSHANGPEK